MTCRPLFVRRPTQMISQLPAFGSKQFATGSPGLLFSSVTSSGSSTSSVCVPLGKRRHDDGVLRQSGGEIDSGVVDSRSQAVVVLSEDSAVDSSMTVEVDTSQEAKRLRSSSLASSSATSVATGNQQPNLFGARSSSVFGKSSFRFLLPSSATGVTSTLPNFVLAMSSQSNFAFSDPNVIGELNKILSFTFI